MISNWDLFSRVDYQTGNVYFSLLIDGTDDDAVLMARELKGYVKAPAKAEPPFIYSFPLPDNLDEPTQDKIRSIVRKEIARINQTDQAVVDGVVQDPFLNPEMTKEPTAFPSFISVNEDTSVSQKPTSLNLDVSQRLSIREKTTIPLRKDSPDNKEKTAKQMPAPPARPSEIFAMPEEEHLENDGKKEQTSYIPVTELAASAESKVTTPPAGPDTVFSMPEEEHLENDGKKEQTSYIPVTELAASAESKVTTPPAKPNKVFSMPEEDHLENEAKKEQTSYIPVTELAVDTQPKAAPQAPTPEPTAKALSAPQPPKKKVPLSPAPAAPQKPISSENIEDRTIPGYIPATDFDALNKKNEPVAATPEKVPATAEENNLPNIALATPVKEDPVAEKPLQQGDLEIADFTFTKTNTHHVPTAEEVFTNKNSADSANDAPKEEESTPFNDHDMLIKDMEGTMLDNMPIEDIFAAETKLDMFVDVNNQENQSEQKEVPTEAAEENSGAENSFDIFGQKLKEQTSIIDLDDVEAFLNQIQKPVESARPAADSDLQIESETVGMEDNSTEKQPIPLQDVINEPAVKTILEEAKNEAIAASDAIVQSPREASAFQEISGIQKETVPSTEDPKEVTASVPEHTFRVPSNHMTEPEEDLPEIIVLRRNDIPEETEEKEPVNEEVLPTEMEVEPEETPAVVEEKPAITEKEPTVPPVKPVPSVPKPATIPPKATPAPVTKKEFQTPTAAEEKPAIAKKEPTVPPVKPAPSVPKPATIPPKATPAPVTKKELQTPTAAEEKQAIAKKEPTVPPVKPAPSVPKPATVPPKATPAPVTKKEFQTPTAAEEKPAIAKKEPTVPPVKPVPSVPKPATIPPKATPAPVTKKEFQTPAKQPASSATTQPPEKKIWTQTTPFEQTVVPFQPLATEPENTAAPISLPRKESMEDNKQKTIFKIKPKTPAAPGAPVPQAPNAANPGTKPVLKRPAPANTEAPEGAQEKTAIDHSIQDPLSELKKRSWPLEVPLNPTFTISNMVMSVNRFAHATAMSVIESPGRVYNPLVFHGETGTGKTHFLNAMAYAFSQKFGQTKIFMTNGVRLSRGIQRYIAEGKIEKFDEFMSSVQVLLIDDIHLLAVNEQNRAYISKLLNTFLQEQKQIVITSKYSPENLEKLEELIKFKLDAGWISELKSPTGPTHIKIIKRMLMDNNIDLNETQINDFFAAKYMSLGAVARTIRRVKVLENLIPTTVDAAQRTHAAIVEKLLAARGEDEKSHVSTTETSAVTSITPQGNGEWGRIGFFYPAHSSDTMNWMVYALQERAKELGLEGGFEIVVRSSYATENIISSAFKIANLCDNKKLKGAVILGPKKGDCETSVKENFYDILTHMLEIMLIRCGIINYETLRHPSTYVKLIAELMR